MRAHTWLVLLTLACAPAWASQRFLVLGDPQPKSTVDVDYFARDIVDPALPFAKDSVATLVLGDIVN